MSQESGRKLLNALLEGKDAEAMKLLKEKVDFSVDCVSYINMPFKVSLVK